MEYLKLMRVRHWVKNLLLFFPIIFSGKLLEWDICSNVIIGFAAFSMTASIIYIFNDLKDVERDKENPQKKNRPLASGAITKKNAVILIGILIMLEAVIWYFSDLGQTFWLYLFCYLFINMAYSMGLKNLPIVDVTILSTGYLLRIFGGGYLAGAEVSHWMFLTVLAASFYLGFGKRRNELLRYGEKGRKILEKYTMNFLDKSMQMFLSLTVVFYALCCADKETTIAREGIDLLWSVPVIIIVLLRYNMLLEGDISDGDPIEVVWQDFLLMTLIIVYGISVLILIYISR